LSAVTDTSPAATRRLELEVAPTAISAEGLSKAFRLPHQRYHSLKERALHPFRARTFDELHALRDVRFEVRRGEFFGIVGRNGSGKSTLLKCLAGIYDIDAGEIAIDGRLSPFIELGVGFNPDLTARENVIINAIMLGLSRKQAQDRFDEIIAFAELEDFLDLKLKNYSSGMHVRLAFSVAIRVDADILLVDEVLAVGDASFQQKCFDQFHRMKNEGRTIVLVTHDMSAVERFCDRAMLIEQGEILNIGEPGAIGRKYNELNFGHTVHSAPGDGGRYDARGAAEILSAWFENAEGERIGALAQGETLRVCFEVRMHEPLEDPIFAATLRNDVQHTIFATSTQWTHGATGRFAPGETAVVRIQFDNWLAPSRYTVTPSVARQGGGADALDLREDLASLIVHATHFTGGVADLPHGFEISRA
jgi:ABC-type polysaccharide/polyol phosphate transport system ATPase subunit